MTLRAQILAQALSHLPTHSFTRLTLLSALQTLRPTLPSSGRENTIDTLFGQGNIGPGRALVERWANEGRRGMGERRCSGMSGVGEVLQARLEYSSDVGESLVDVSESGMLSPLFDGRNSCVALQRSPSFLQP